MDKSRAIPIKCAGQDGMEGYSGTCFSLSQARWWRRRASSMPRAYVHVSARKPSVYSHPRTTAHAITQSSGCSHVHQQSAHVATGAFSGCSKESRRASQNTLRIQRWQHCAPRFTDQSNGWQVTMQRPWLAARQGSSHTNTSPAHRHTHTHTRTHTIYTHT